MPATINRHRAAPAFWLVLGLSLLALLPASAVTHAADPENCLICHRYRGMGRLDDNGQSVRLFHVDPDYYERLQGPHARLRCTDCHPRDEVQVVPHKPVSAVNCTTECHLVAPGQTEVLFSHAGVEDMLLGSVHNDATLAECNRLLDTPLREGQTTCLLCHDEPRFSRSDESWLAHATQLSRCDTCHQDLLTTNTTYMYWHVVARTRTARSHEDSVRVCAMCHSHEAIREEFSLPDATASYLISFHGKAMLLGNNETAICLDCHAAEMQNIHHVLSHEDPAATTHPSHLADTCRSPACHPAAGALITDAAVHLELTPSRLAASGKSREADDEQASAAASTTQSEDSSGGGTGGLSDLSIEYLIAIIFIFLIVSTFGPSLMLQSLELIQLIVGRHDPQQHRREVLAKRLQRDPVGREALIRFTVDQRLQHWLLAITFTLLVLTGFPIKFADRAWAVTLIDMMGGLNVARQIHRYAGLILMLGAVYHLAVGALWVWQHHKATGKNLLLAAWDLPMLPKPSDIKELLHLLGYLFFLKPTRPVAGRFSLKEKFEYFGVFWGCTLLGLTGFLMWGNAFTTRFFSGRLLNYCILIHTFEAFLALLHVGIFHMIGVIFNPHAFPLSMAMLTGDTPPAELAEVHGVMIEDAAALLDESGPLTTETGHDG
jgi:formate dehydrogenase gamma subunit